jgi:predicted CXXCH cytochrome family protein
MPPDNLEQTVRAQSMNVKVLAVGILTLSVMFLAGASSGDTEDLFLENAPYSLIERRDDSHPDTNKGTDDCWDCDLKTQDMAYELRNTESALCYKCHDRLDTQTWVHGPVAVGECIICHDDYHGPNSAKDLARKSQRTCFNCHDKNRLGQHVEQMNSGNCADCHNPHSSSDHRLLHYQRQVPAERRMKKQPGV